MAERTLIRKVTGDAVSQMLPGELGYNQAANQLILGGFFGAPVVVSSGPPTTTVVSQATPSALWDITHNLHRYPSVSVVDSSGRLVEGDVAYTSSDRLTIAFTAAFSGSAYLN